MSKIGWVRAQVRRSVFFLLWLRFPRIVYVTESLLLIFHPHFSVTESRWECECMLKSCLCCRNSVLLSLNCSAWTQCTLQCCICFEYTIGLHNTLREKWKIVQNTHAHMSARIFIEATTSACNARIELLLLLHTFDAVRYNDFVQSLSASERWNGLMTMYAFTRYFWILFVFCFICLDKM